MKKILMFFLILYSLPACNGRKMGIVVNEESKRYNTMLTPVLNGVKEFSLDDETASLAIRYLQYIDLDSVRYFSLLNDYNHSLYFYNYDSLDIVNQLQYNKPERPLRDVIQGYYYLNSDSIFLYSPSVGNGILYGMNEDNFVFYKYPLKREAYITNQTIYPSPWCRTWTPLKKWKNKIITIGFVGGEMTEETPNNRPVIIICDIGKGELEYAVNYPKQYSAYNWGGAFTYRLPYYDINHEKLLISFSAHHNLISHSLLTGEEKSHYAGSAKITEIKSFPRSKSSPIEEDEVLDWYYKNPSYEGIYYDKYAERYYRIAKLPVPASEYIKDEYNYKPTVVIVLDSELNYIGEAPLPPEIKYRTMNCFVSPDGLNIEVLTGDEDKMTFFQYKFSKHE